MSEKGSENLDDLLLGNVKEGAAESSEQISDRVAAVQARLAGIKRDEGQAKTFDLKLIQVLKSLPPVTVVFVAFLIDAGIPSLTILAILAIINDEAGQICFAEFPRPAMATDFSLAQFQDSKIQRRVELWWSFIFSAEEVSKTVKIKNLQSDERFIKKFSLGLAQLLHDFLLQNEIQEFDTAALKKLLKKYEKRMFGEEA